MRIVTFSRDGRTQHGTRNGGRVRVHPSATSAVDLAMNPALHPAGEELALADITLLSPVPSPGKIICIGLNYRAHAMEGGFAIPDYPAVFMRCTTSLGEPGSDLLLTDCSEQFDFEAELAIVIGRRAARVGAAALDHVAGYSCFNDGSIRDYQRKSTQWTMGKNFDRTGAFGPELVTADELPPGAAGLRIQSRLNGEVMQDSNTTDMIFDAAALISVLSDAMTLEPGDVIAAGTPSGVGYARKPPVYMRAGDRIEVEIERIGTLSNTIAAPRART